MRRVIQSRSFCCELGRCAKCNYLLESKGFPSEWVYNCMRPGHETIIAVESSDVITDDMV